MTDDELSQAIRVCQQERGRMVRQGLKGTAEYQENNAAEDRLLDELFTLRFSKPGQDLQPEHEQETICQEYLR